MVKSETSKGDFWHCLAHEQDCGIIFKINHLLLSAPSIISAEVRNLSLSHKPTTTLPLLSLAASFPKLPWFKSRFLLLQEGHGFVILLFPFLLQYCIFLRFFLSQEPVIFPELSCSTFCFPFELLFKLLSFSSLPVWIVVSTFDIAAKREGGLHSISRVLHKQTMKRRHKTDVNERDHHKKLLIPTRKKVVRN